MKHSDIVALSKNIIPASETHKPGKDYKDTHNGRLHVIRGYVSSGVMTKEEAKLAGKLIREESMKKRTAKKRNPIVSKLLDLKYRINDAYRLIKNGQGKPKLSLSLLGDTRIDKQWLMTLISDVRSFGRTELAKEDMLKCNGLWRKYETK